MRRALASSLLLALNACSSGGSSSETDASASAITSASASSSTSASVTASTSAAGTTGQSTGASASDTSGGPQTSSATTGVDSDATTGEVTTGPLFECEPLPADSPVLQGIVLYDPATPHPGDTLTVIVRATNGLGRLDAPPLALEVTGPDGVSVLEPMAVEGGEVLYYFAIDDVQLGELCVRGLIDGATEVASSITVTPRPPGPPREEGAVFKVTQNHMWTCDEQPDWGNELHVYVLDEQGQPLAGRAVDVRVADSTDLDSIYNEDEQPVPDAIVTDADGHALLYNVWPISDNGLLVLQLAVSGVASDVATEITTGWWEDYMGCKFCEQPLRNVWGHWSHSVTFQRTQGARAACRVPTDHAGMDPQKCGPPRHVHHHPDHAACWAVP